MLITQEVYLFVNKQLFVIIQLFDVCLLFQVPVERAVATTFRMEAVSDVFVL